MITKTAAGLRLAVTLALGLPACAATAQYKQDHLCVDGSDRLCPTIPADLDGLEVRVQGYTPSTDRNPDPDTAQQINFDYFGWQSFVALNWPADGEGRPSGDILGDDKSPRVWQSYPGVEQVFPGARLASPICPDNGRLTLSQTSKITTSSYVQPFTPWPLIDAAGNFVLYDMRVNPRWAAYVRDNGLDTRKGQAAFAAKGGEWDLPRGAGDTPGAIELKTSWRLLPEDESGADYFTQPVNVIVEARNSASGQAMCIDGRAALIGMHIMQKVTTPDEFAPFWIWASFEHDRNAPLARPRRCRRRTRRRRCKTASRRKAVRCRAMPATVGRCSIRPAPMTARPARRTRRRRENSSSGPRRCPMRGNTCMTGASAPRSPGAGRSTTPAPR
ncbi:MAG: hypothetical protein R3D85_02450 [Paracoccaceae bacterium]